MKFLLLLSLFLGTCPPAQVDCPTQASVPVPQQTPNETVSAGVDRVSRLAGLAPLKTAKRGKADLEVRVWYGFGLILLEGFVIKRINNQWHAFHLKADGHSTRYITKVARIRLPAPRSGWKKCWQRLADAGVLTLPSEIGEPDPDVEGFYVETVAHGAYRNYEYISPEYSESPNAKRMLAIGDVIFEEFGLARFHVAKPSR